MSDVVLVALIAAVPGTIAAILSAIGNRKVEQIHVQVNSRMDQLLASVGRENQAEGRAAGVESERLRGEAERPLP